MEVIVVDEKSNDGSIEMIRKEFPWVKVIEGENKGLAVSSNLGAKEATGEYLLFLGPDAYPRHRTIEGMVDYMEKHPQVGLATPKVYLQQGGLDFDAHRSFPTPWSSFTRLTGLYKLFPKSQLFNSYFMSNSDLNKDHEIDACVYGFMLVKKNVFEKVNGFDPEYFAHGLDLDLCYRIKHTGHKIMYVPQYESGHFKLKVTQTKAALTQQEKKSLSDDINYVKSSTNAMRVFLRKNYQNKYPFYLIWFMNIGTYLLELQRMLYITIKYLFS